MKPYHTILSLLAILGAIIPWTVSAETVTPELPNLRVLTDSFSCKPEPLVGNKWANCYLTVSNIGGSPARRVIAYVGIDSNYIGQRSIGTLAVGATRKVRVPVDLYPVHGGSYLFEASAFQDWDHVPQDMLESGDNREDNVIYRKLDILGNEPIVSIATSSLKVLTARPRPGKTVLVRAYIKNTSRARAKDMNIVLTNGTSTLMDRIINVPAGTRRYVSYTWKIPANATGTLPLTLTIDPNHWLFTTSTTSHQQSIEVRF